MQTTLTPWRPGLGMSAWDDESNYIGSRVDGYFVYAMNRDSDSLTRSNFDCIARDLRKEAEKHGAPDCIEEHEFGHWACGWVKQLILASNAPEALFRAAEAIHADLEDYPVYNEDHWSELEYNEAADFWDSFRPRDKVQEAAHAREQIHWCAKKPVWVYGRLDWCGLCDRADKGDAIARHLVDTFLHS